MTVIYFVVSLFSFDRISLNDILDPELNAYSVSQYEHLSGQPVNLIKCVGKPDLEVSPCIE